MDSDSESENFEPYDYSSEIEEFDGYYYKEEKKIDAPKEEMLAYRNKLDRIKKDFTNKLVEVALLDEKLLEVYDLLKKEYIELCEEMQAKTLTNPDNTVIFYFNVPYVQIEIMTIDEIISRLEIRRLDFIEGSAKKKLESGSSSSRSSTYRDNRAYKGFSDETPHWIKNHGPGDENEQKCKKLLDEQEPDESDEWSDDWKTELEKSLKEDDKMDKLYDRYWKDVYKE